MQEQRDEEKTRAEKLNREGHGSSWEQYGEGQLTPKAKSRVTWKPTVEAFFTIYTYKKELYIE